MNKSIKATLEQNGHNTSNYLSLLINKGDLPSGGEVIIMVKDKRTNDLRPINLEQPQDKREFAQSSRFYGKVMEDGHLFHPYIHRRYIAVQFRRLIRRYGCQGIKQGVAMSYDWDYAVDILRKEVHRLANLDRHDCDGFMERSRFFTLERCAEILTGYAAAASSFIDTCMGSGAKDNVFIPKHGYVQKANIRPMKHRFACLAEQAKECKSYRLLDNLLSKFDWLSLPNNLVLPLSFVEPFIEEGAYYTMKHHMMFEGLSMWGYPQRASLEYLRKHTGSYLELYECIMK